MKLKDAICLIGSLYGLQKTDGFDMRGQTGEAFDTIQNVSIDMLEALETANADISINGRVESNWSTHRKIQAAIAKAKGLS